METLDHIQTKAHDLSEQIRPKLDAARERLTDVNGQVVAFIKAHPGKCLVGAVAIGYLVGRIAGRSRHSS